MKYQEEFESAIWFINTNMNNCLHCGAPCKRKYCSHKCSNIHNPRRNKKPLPKCVRCDNIVDYHRSKFCKECKTTGYQYVRIGNIPVKDRTIEQSVANQKSKSGSSKYNGIRNHAYRLYRRELQNAVCQSCGFKPHVELCHIKPISSFAAGTLVSVINDRSNIMFLCPNCHWIHDNTHKG